MHALAQRLIERIDHAAASAGDLPVLRLRKTLLIFLGAAGVGLAPWGAFYLYGAGQRLAAAVVLGHACVAALATVLLLVRRQVRLPAALQLVSLLVVPWVLQVALGGFSASGAAILWALLAPLCALVMQGTRAALWWFVAYALQVLGCAFVDIGHGVALSQVLLYSENVLLVSALAFFALRFFVIERERAQAALEAEQAKSEALLLNILPAAIAQRLKDSGETIADGYAQASILFADLVGFTSLSATMKPDALVAMLSRLFSRFDEISTRYGVEKIKTIGDAYMACAGVPLARADHAEAVADMALAMRAALLEHNREFGSSLQIRIGINSGPVVAGVIGLKKFIYDLWGDAVNFASRMESHGLPGAIQVSAATYALLRGSFELEPRGVIEVKGIGPVQAYLLLGRKAG